MFTLTSGTAQGLAEHVVPRVHYTVWAVRAMHAWRAQIQTAGEATPGWGAGTLDQLRRVDGFGYCWLEGATESGNVSDVGRLRGTPGDIGCAAQCSTGRHF